MKKIAVLTSGGDAQGMNAAIYGIFGRAQELGYELYGIRNGYAGLLREDIVKLHREECAAYCCKRRNDSGNCPL